MLRRELAGCLAGLLLALSTTAVYGVGLSPSKLLGYCADTVGPPLPAPLVDNRARSADVAVDNSQGLQDVFYALSVLQDKYFDVGDGTWPSSIEWTGAVVETVLAGTLSTLSRSLNSTQWASKENLISSIYAQVVHSFFGQDVVSIRNQAYDDILWVVLDWIEAIKFVRLHAQLHYPATRPACKYMPRELAQALHSSPWQGFHWLCAFARRAREFWQLATPGWDTRLCGGGMIWNPRLAPYKNAITNELWIAASVAVYEQLPDKTSSTGFPALDPLPLAAAVEGYRWLKQVNMTNQQGLFVDGYHIDGSKPNNVQCDVRDEVVYTYNQGVILTGQRSLWAATSNSSYLDEGHALVRSVIRATGWDTVGDRTVDDVRALPPGQLLPPWRGLGRGGILEEACDASGTCSQDGQTFKGIFFHHLTAFCAPVAAAGAEATHARAAHGQACSAYLRWVEHNARAALGTRDEAGRFGMW